MNWLRTRLPQLFGIDLRTLALFRAALGLVLAVDMCLRMSDARAFYTDAGVMPRSWLAVFSDPWRLSLYMANGQTWFALTLLGLEALASLALMLGWRTRLAALLCLVLQVSLLNRNVMVLIGGDMLLTCLLFWSLFLPLGARWSVDTALSLRPPPSEQQHLSWASAGLLLQVLSVYFFSAVLKSGHEWWPDGSAVYYALQLDMYATPIGVWLRQFPQLLHGLTYFVWWLELLGPLLALSPLFNRPMRFALMLLFLAMHLGFLLCLALGPFPFISAASLTVLAGGWIWDALDRRAQRREQAAGALPLRIYYDQDCAFCLKSCQLLRTFLVLPRAQIIPAQDYPRAKALLEANFSWVVIDHDDHAYLKWPALVLLLRRSPLFAWKGWLLSGVWAVAPGNAVYDFVGRHRGAFGSFSAALLPYRDAPFEPGRTVQRLAAVAVVLMLAWNLCTVKWLPGGLLDVLKPPFRVARLDQYWNMFAPFPSRDDGWYVFPGELADGTQLDVLRPDQAGISYDKPDFISLSYPNIRWHRYREGLWSAQFADNRLYYGKYLCRQWNRAHPAAQALKSFKMIYMLQQTQPPSEPRTVEQHVLWRHECLDEAAAETPTAPLAGGGGWR
jgi:predicted DCC family thiol-disulfide oxidoreductase YuxK